MRLSLSFGIILRKLRQERGLTQEELAERLDRGSRAYICCLESGIKRPSLEMVFRLCRALDIKPSEFVKLVEEMDNEF